MTIDRRTLLLNGARAGACALALPRLAGSARDADLAWVTPLALTKFTEPLTVPSVIDLRHGGTRPVTMHGGSHVFHQALGPVRTFGYDTMTYLGPTVITQRGVPVQMIFRNSLGSHPLASVVDPAVPGTLVSDRYAPRASLHLHGGKTMPQYDGHPDDWFVVGRSHRYVYLQDHEACSLWYHDHAVGITRLNVQAGLAGAYLIRDRWDTGDKHNGPGLPFGPFELPLIIQDKSFVAKGNHSAMFYPRRDPAVAATLPPGSPRIWVPEFFGDVAVVNGKVWPFLTVARSVYRFRVLNGSDARFYHLFFEAGGPPIWQIGTDQGLLDAPVLLTDGLVLAPAERADLLIDFSHAAAGQEWVLHNDAPVPFPDGDDTLPAIPEIMKFAVSHDQGPFHTIPSRLREHPLPTLVVNGVTRNTTLQEKLTAGGQSYGTLLNGVPYNTAENNIIHARRGQVELWNIINLTGDAHPMHIHLIAFQILERVPFTDDQAIDAYIAAWNVDPGSLVPILGYGVGTDHSAEPYLDTARATPPAPSERGWKDTVICPPGQVTRLAVPFAGIPFATDQIYLSQGRRAIRGYVWHCHILEHEDLMMMQRYRVS